MKKTATPSPRPKLTPALLRRLNTALATRKREARAKVQEEKRQEQEDRRSRARIGATMTYIGE